MREYKIKLQLWDTAGQERLVYAGVMIPFHFVLSFRFRSMAPMYYRRANAAMIVYDVTRQSTFEEAKEWIKGEFNYEGQPSGHGYVPMRCCDVVY